MVVRILALIFFWLVAAAPAFAGQDAMESAAARVKSAIAACTDRHDYDPDKVDDLGPHELASGERAWLSCAYAAVERHLTAHTGIPAMYELLIREHRTLTDRVELGEITRDQRRARTDEIVASIKRQEDVHRSAAERRLREIGDVEEQRRQIERINRVYRDIHQTLRRF